MRKWMEERDGRRDGCTGFRRRADARAAAPRFEALEERTLMSAVAAGVVEGVLTVAGDANAGHVVIKQVRNRDGEPVIRVIGKRLDGQPTLINGNNAATFSAGVNGLIVDTGGGNDRIVIRRLDVDGDGVIFGSGGNERITVLGGLFAGDLVIQTGGGDDRIAINGAAVTGFDGPGGLFIDAGLGRDVINIDGANVPGGLIDVNAGIFGGANGLADRFARRDGDRVRIDNANALELAVFTGAGNDTLSIGRSTFDTRALVDGGAGAFDTLTIHDLGALGLDPVGFEQNIGVTPGLTRFVGNFIILAPGGPVPSGAGVIMGRGGLPGLLE